MTKKYYEGYSRLTIYKACV